MRAHAVRRPARPASTTGLSGRESRTTSAASASAPIDPAGAAPDASSAAGLRSYPHDLLAACEQAPSDPAAHVAEPDDADGSHVSLLRDGGGLLEQDRDAEAAGLDADAR